MDRWDGEGDKVVAPQRLVTQVSTGAEGSEMKTEDVVNVLKLARVELVANEARRKAEAHADFEKSCDAVEMWLREIGALPPR